MMSRAIPVLVTLAGLATDARAECGLTIAGDADLVRAVEALLVERGVDVSRACELRVEITRERDTILLRITNTSGPFERTVTELATAATVIESFVRDDAAPLMPIRPRVAAEPRTEHVLVVRHVAPPPEHPSLQVFGAAETSLGSDHTSWLGAQVGLCIQLGPVCAAARLRRATVVAGEGMWSDMRRYSTELLLGVDIPFAIGRMSLTPGFAAGMGSMWTRSSDRSTAAETGGLRADVHATFGIPLTSQWTLDLSAALQLTQETRVESDSERMAIPDEPLALVRFGVGIRWGRR